MLMEHPKYCEDAVSRAAAIKQIEWWFGVLKQNPDILIDAIKTLPSAQPEIVRCKDCKHRGSYWGNCRLLEEKYHQSVLVDDDGFCSLAERRTDEQTD